MRRDLKFAAGGRSPLRVLFIVADAGLTPTVSVHLTLMRQLLLAGVEVHAVIPKASERPPWRGTRQSVAEQIPPGVEVVRFEFGPAGGGTERSVAAAARYAAPMVRDLSGLGRYVRRRRIDLVHCEYMVQNAGLGNLLARRSSARYLVHMHANYGAWLKPASVHAMRQAAAVVTVSRWVARTVHERGGLPQGSILPVLNGIEVERWNPEADREPFRHELSLTAEDPLLVQVAQLAEWKRQHVVVEAFARLLARHPRAHLALVGAEHIPLGYEERLRSDLRRAGIGDRVTLTGGRSDVEGILAAADLVVHPSCNEPFGLGFVEAMVMGRSLIASDTGAAPEIVEDGITGRLVGLDDVAELTRTMGELIEDPEHRRALGAAARDRALEHFAAARMAADMVAVYRQLAQNPLDVSAA